jgi:hypothetical protein
MRTSNEIVMEAPVDVCLRAGADVEGWPAALPHYRWVRFLRKDGWATGRVEMAAQRHFGPLAYPVWWVSEMTVDPEGHAVHYQHVQGITRGMNVVWSFEPRGEAETAVTIVHDWDTGPAWPLPGILRRWIADRIIGPVFIHHVAGRTLAGIRARARRMYFESKQISP